jgi:phosphoribosylglycinamide formyltransferase-1
MKLLKLAIFASGTGSNFQAIFHAIRNYKLNAKIQVVISNHPDAGALAFARQQNIPAIHLSRDQFASGEKFDAAVLACLAVHAVDFIALAGYMKKIRPKIIRSFKNRILNIHPALLPAFGGKGLYGHFVHEAVLAHGCKLSGVSVHLVDEDYDCGPIVLQEAVPVFENDTPDSLAARVLKAEHQSFYRALQYFAEERVQIQGRRVLIKLPAY